MKNANFMAPIKAFFSKAWTATKAFSIKAGKWIVANKLISIPVAVVLVGGIACAIALPIALHEHDFATEWSSDANNHWHSAICSHEEETSDLGAHAYDNACDTTCNVCGATRTVGAHVYDNDCDTTCNTCGATRTVGAHVYDNACDTTCNNCGATRAITHDHADTLTAGDTTHYYLCSVCGDKKDEVAHVFDKTVASSEYLKAEATATTKAQYYKSCVCGKASATEYFETDKAPANLQVSDISKTYDGTPVSEPTVTFDGVGAENFAYYKGNEKLTERPTDAGTYKVVVTVDETDTHVGDRVEREFTIAKKVLSNVNASVIYDGSTTFGEITLAHDGIVAGDVIIADIDVANKNVGVYTGTGAMFTILDGLGNGAANYELDLATCTASIVPKVLTNISVGDATYKGTTNFTFVLSAYHGLVSGETFTLQATTASKDVGNAVEIASISYNNSNYNLDKSEITLNIVPKVLNNITYSFTYNGSDYQQVVLTSANHSGILGSDQVTLEVCFVDSIVGAAVDTSSPEMAPVFIDDNYELGDNYNFSIVPKKLNRLDIEFTYDGGNIPSSFDLTAADGVIAGDDVWLYGDCNQSYDEAPDEYTLFALDWEGNNAYTKEYVEIRGADAANYEFTYATDESVGEITVMPYVLDFTGNYVKAADGTNNVTFTQTVNHSYGDVTVKVVLPLLDLQGTPITASGIYTELSATFGTPAFYVNDAVVKGYDLSDSFYPDDLADRQFTVEITGELFATIDTYYSSRNLINLISVDRGAIKPGDVLTVIAPDGTTTTVTVAKIVKGGSEKNYVSHTSSDFGNYGLGLTNIGDASKLVRGAVLIHEGDTAPKATSVIFGTMSTVTNDSVTYVVTPSNSYEIVIHGRTFTCKITPLNADQTIAEGGSAQVMISLTGGTVYTVAGEAFTIRSATLNPMATGTVEDITVAVDTETTIGQTQLVHDPIDIAAGETVVFKITNTLGRNVTRFALWGDSARLDAKDDAYTVALYDSNGALIEATYDVDQYTFDKSDSTEYAVADGQTVYVVLTLTKAVDSVELTFY